MGTAVARGQLARVADRRGAARCALPGAARCNPRLSNAPRSTALRHAEERLQRTPNCHDGRRAAWCDNRDGVPYDNGNNVEDFPDDGQDYLAICQHYTTETEGGHLGRVSAGKIRVAKAFWVLMARIAGWDGR